MSPVSRSRRAAWRRCTSSLVPVKKTRHPRSMSAWPSEQARYQEVLALFEGYLDDALQVRQGATACQLHPALNLRTDTPQRNVEPTDNAAFVRRSVCHRRGACEASCGRQPPLCPYFAAVGRSTSALCERARSSALSPSPATMAATTPPCDVAMATRSSYLAFVIAMCRRTCCSTSL
jgi:hypothetical protein